MMILTKQIVGTLSRVAGITVLVFYTGIVLGQSAFDRADSNGNGSIDPEEFRSYMADIFFHLDRNRSGLLEDEELDYLNPERLQPSDANGDGMMSMKEFLNSSAWDFHQLDTDENNALFRHDLD